MSKEYTITKEEGIKRICEAIREAYAISDAIDDEHLATNSTFSSVKINSLLSDIDTRVDNLENGSGSGGSGGSITIDNALSDTSENPVQNKVVNAALNEKASKDTMTGATSSANGTSGLVPAPAAGKQASYLRGDGTWATPEFTGTLDDIPDGEVYYKSPYYIQAGTVTKASPMTVTFPVAYKTAPVVVCTAYLAEGSNTSGTNYYLKTLTKTTGITIYSPSGGAFDGVNWVAFGEV